MVGTGPKRRLFVDGAGLCSPGLWPPERRLVKQGAPRALRDMIEEELTALGNTRSGGLKRLLADLASGRISSDPFPSSSTDRIRGRLSETLSKELERWIPIGEVQDQPFKVRLLGTFLRDAGDPDWEFLKTVECGVRIGVGVALPRTPAVYPEKLAWRLREQRDLDLTSNFDDVEGKWRNNYSSAVNFASEVEEALEEQARRGQILITSEESARSKYGARLTVAALGAIEKGTREDGTTEIRIVHDGTHGVDINTKIKVQDATPCPTAPDIKTALRLQAARRTPYFGLTADVKEAHRLIPVDPLDWPLQACQVRPGGNIYLNKVGTYGVASAAYWWGRMGACLQRAIYYTLARVLPTWIFLYADDWDFSAEGERYIQSLLTSLWVLVIFGAPMSWKKCSGGFTYSWIGYEKSLSEWKLGISARRAQWLEGWFSRVLNDNRVLIRELREALGRMVFVYGALTYDKPFLAPLFAFMSLSRPGACVPLPLFVRMIIGWLRERLRRRRSHPCTAQRTALGLVMRVDAKAEGMEVGIGGWLPTAGPDGTIDKSISPWFAMTLTETDAPWAFEKGLPFKVISALELLASTVGFMLFKDKLFTEPNCDASILVTGITDSQVSANVITRGMSSAYPLCCIAMELAAQLEDRSAQLSLEWGPRELNSEADALADMVSTGFSSEHQVGTDLSRLSWHYLPSLLREGSAFYAAAREQKAARRPQSDAANEPRRKAARRSLREREPW